jgi:hypothetical protein
MLPWQKRSHHHLVPSAERGGEILLLQKYHVIELFVPTA